MSDDDYLQFVLFFAGVLLGVVGQRLQDRGQRIFIFLLAVGLMSCGGVWFVSRAAPELLDRLQQWAEVAVPTPASPTAVAGLMDSPHPTITRAPSPTPFQPQPGPTEDVSAILSDLVDKESAYFIKQDLAGLRSLWTNYGSITDMRLTDAPEDDQVWRGWGEIRQRYEHEFSLGNQVLNDNLRTGFFTDYGASGVSDLWVNQNHLINHYFWTFAREGGVWKISELEFNRPQ